MSSIEERDLKIVFKKIENEYNINRFKWSLNPYSDRSFQLWMHKVKITFNAWKMDYKIIPALFDANIPVQNVLESIVSSFFFTKM